jgi:F0F1-type ATP synthase epsilon subunit
LFRGNVELHVPNQLRLWWWERHGDSNWIHTSGGYGLVYDHEITILPGNKPLPCRLFRGNVELHVPNQLRLWWWERHGDSHWIHTSGGYGLVYDHEITILPGNKPLPCRLFRGNVELHVPNQLRLWWWERHGDSNWIHTSGGYGLVYDHEITILPGTTELSRTRFC